MPHQLPWRQLQRMQRPRVVQSGRHRRWQVRLPEERTARVLGWRRVRPLRQQLLWPNVHHVVPRSVGRTRVLRARNLQQPRRWPLHMYRGLGCGNVVPRLRRWALRRGLLRRLRRLQRRVTLQRSWQMLQWNPRQRHLPVQPLLRRAGLLSSVPQFLQQQWRLP